MTPTPRKVTKKPNREGALIFGFTPKQLDAQNVLLEPGIRTYEDGAKRLGTTLDSITQDAKARILLQREEEEERKKREEGSAEA
ncbi:MAG: hypothetical protein KGI38_12320 [Thaumarchaeota archaeon]|nr:hypothetical protein [Nitrososphaerota archaeon]